MSLIRLLTVSHSFSSSQEKTGRYRVGGKRALPDFGWNVQGTDFVARSSRHRPDPEVRVTRSELSSDAAAMVRVSPLPSSHAASNGSELCFREIAARQSREVHSESVPPPRQSLWRRFCNRFLRLSAPPEAHHAVVANPSGRLVQSALRLNQVEVVRNDLTDADYEVVSGRKPGWHEALGKGRSTGSRSAHQGTLNLFSAAKRWFL